MSLFLQLAFQNFGGEAVARRSAKSATYYKNIFNSGEWNVVFEEVQSDHFHCQGRSGCWARHHNSFFDRVWRVGQLFLGCIWGVFGVCLIPCLIHLSVCGSLPANTPTFSCNINLDLGGLHLDSILEYTEAARIAECRSSCSFNCTFHVEIWWCQSSIQLSARRSYGMKGKKIALLNFSLSSRNPCNGFRSAWMYLDALRWFCDFFFSAS